MVSPTDGRRSVSSASTQTDDSLPDISTPIQPSKPTQPSVKPAPAYRFMDISPREEKSKRIAYAQALKEQIEEKKRLEDEKRRREKEEEELEERRYREQAQRMQKEYDCEQNLKLDMVIQVTLKIQYLLSILKNFQSNIENFTRISSQRQAQEELLRPRLAETDEEVKELKMRERLNRLRNGTDVNANAGRGVSIANLAAAHANRQHLQINGRAMDEALASVPSVNVLPEQDVEPAWDQDWSKYMQLEGVDLLREHRSQKERLQLPPVVDTASKLEQKTRWSREKSPVENGGYLPSSSGDAVRRTQAYREQAEAILRAPLDEEIISINPQEQRSAPQLPQRADTKRSAVSLPPPNRPKSPVLPALRTESRLRRNSKILDEKWQSLIYTRNRHRRRVHRREVVSGPPTPNVNRQPRANRQLPPGTSADAFVFPPRPPPNGRQDDRGYELLHEAGHRRGARPNGRVPPMADSPHNSHVQEPQTCTGVEKFPTLEGDSCTNVYRHLLPQLDQSSRGITWACRDFNKTPPNKLLHYTVYTIAAVAASTSRLNTPKPTPRASPRASPTPSSRPSRSQSRNPSRSPSRSPSIYLRPSPRPSPRSSPCRISPSPSPQPRPNHLTVDWR
ncbi:unnamed protein product [Nesidiocoris tenuis]|uniref:Uncharacterized protein n=1 Tax=Nesidiocoris tenuis TaxID=355587 RepID=A0A6H5HVU9_9HEMI|nr:unnamed protein product [Nesidiocoris tenuis]